jgi:hypothetical protein
MSELPTGTAGAATVLIIGPAAWPDMPWPGADRIAGQPSRPSLASPVIKHARCMLGVPPQCF